MATETIATIMITLLCCIIMAVLDVVICGLLNLIGVVSFKKAFLWGLCSFVLPPLFIIYGSLIGRNRLEVKEVELAFNNLPESFDGYRIVQISDIHARSFEGREGGGWGGGGFLY